MEATGEDTGGLVEALRGGGALVLAPLTRGGGLPFRRLGAAQGAEVAVSARAYAQQVAQRSRSVDAPSAEVKTSHG